MSAEHDDGPEGKAPSFEQAPPTIKLALIALAVLLGCYRTVDPCEPGGTSPLCTTTGGASGVCRAGDCVRRCNPTDPFTSDGPLDTINTGEDEGGARLSGDELTLYFHADRAAGDPGPNIMIATRATPSASFDGEMQLLSVDPSPDAPSYWPSATADGLDLYMLIGFVGSIVHAERSAPGIAFTAISNVNLGFPTVHVPYVLPDDSAIYFAADDGGAPTDGLDIFRAARNSDGTFAAATLVLIDTVTPSVMAAGAGYVEETPAITRDELTLYFASNNSADLANMGGFDMYVATRPNTGASFGVPVPVQGSTGAINTADQEWPSWISPDNCELYYTRAPPAAPGELYVARRTPR
jgi:hypothetical protein